MKEKIEIVLEELVYVLAFIVLVYCSKTDSMLLTFCICCIAVSTFVVYKGYKYYKEARIHDVEDVDRLYDDKDIYKN